ncbi:MAG: hypothetical protein ACRC4L_00660 [Mycoplasma sp.]
MKKIKINGLKKWLTFGMLGAVMIIPIPLLIISSKSDAGKFVLANYQSYMAPEVMENLTDEYKISFDSFETAEDSKRLLKNNTADITNTSSSEIEGLINDDLVKEINWENFGIEGISNADDALELFTPSVQEFLNTTISGKEVNLLKYGIPYFLQDLVFVYRGEEIPELHNDELTWSTAINLILKEDRFSPNKNKPNLICLDDARTMYSLPRSIETESNSVNPNDDASIEEIENTYSYFSNTLNKIGSKSIKFNTDSNAVLNSVATKEVTGGFMFNGDAIFASFGGDDEIEIDEDDFHVVKPIDNVVALDLFVINKKLEGDNLNKTYDILNKLCLDEGNSVEDIDEESMAFKNFDYVNYTPTLNSFYEYVTDYDELNYFDEWQIPMVEVNLGENDKYRIENHLSDLVKSNFGFAWIGFKSSLK